MCAPVCDFTSGVILIGNESLEFLQSSTLKVLKLCLNREREGERWTEGGKEGGDRGKDPLELSKMVAQGLRTTVSLAEDSSSIPSTHMGGVAYSP